MRTSSIKVSMNFKSRKVGSPLPEGIDYSLISKGGTPTDADKLRYQRCMRKGERIPETRDKLILAEIPSTLDFVGGYCPNCKTLDRNDIAQEALLTLVEEGKTNTRPSVSRFERAVQRKTKRGLIETVRAEKIKSGCLSIDELKDEPVTLLDCQKKNSSSRTEAMYGLLENILNTRELSVVEGRHLLPDAQRRSYESLADELGTSVGKVRAIESEALKKLRNPENVRSIQNIASDDFYGG